MTLEIKLFSGIIYKLRHKQKCNQPSCKESRLAPSKESRLSFCPTCVPMNTTGKLVMMENCNDFLCAECADLWFARYSFCPVCGLESQLVVTSDSFFYGDDKAKLFERHRRCAASAQGHGSSGGFLESLRKKFANGYTRL